MVKGKGPHSPGIRIRENEDVTGIEVRSTETDRPSAVEEELHGQYLGNFGKLPKYTPLRRFVNTPLKYFVNMSNPLVKFH